MNLISKNCTAATLVHNILNTAHCSQEKEQLRTKMMFCKQVCR